MKKESKTISAGELDPGKKEETKGTNVQASSAHNSATKASKPAMITSTAHQVLAARHKNKVRSRKDVRTIVRNRRINVGCKVPESVHVPRRAHAALYTPHLTLTLKQLQRFDSVSSCCKEGHRSNRTSVSCATGRLHSHFNARGALKLANHKDCAQLLLRSLSPRPRRYMESALTGCG